MSNNIIYVGRYIIDGFLFRFLKEIVVLLLSVVYRGSGSLVSRRDLFRGGLVGV